MYVSIGELRHRITVLRPRAEPDESGNLVTGSYDEVFSCWAKVLPYASRISGGYAEQVSEIDYRIVIRYREDVLDTDVIEWNGKRLSIIGQPYAMDGIKRWLVMECREFVESET